MLSTRSNIVNEAHTPVPADCSSGVINPLKQRQVVTVLVLIHSTTLSNCIVHARWLRDRRKCIYMQSRCLCKQLPPHPAAGSGPLAALTFCWDS